MELKEVVEKFREDPKRMRMGKYIRAKRYKCDPEDIVKARRIIREEINKRKINTPKILIFDIETSPMKAYVWKLWKEDINLPQIIDDWFVIAWSAKWLYSNEVMGEVLTSEEVKAENDFRIVKDLWELFNKADIIVAHNGDKFDIPKMNARFVINNLPPTKPFFSVDTCRIARKQFGFSSNKLEALATYYGFKHKLDTNFDLWKDCLEGDKEALKYMLMYNKQDVKLLEEVYIKLRPWIKGHPNCGNFIESKVPVCCNCCSEDLELLEGEYYYTSAYKYPLYRCKKCGAISRGRYKVGDSAKLLSNCR